MVDIQKYGLYIHIPFCNSKCHYCSFTSTYSPESKRKVEIETYLDYLMKEASLYPKYKFNSLYLGGGTPSLLSPQQVNLIASYFDTTPNAEITMELNPFMISKNELLAFKEAGINRLSIGIQSFNDETLKRLGRNHSANEARKTFTMAREAGFDNISLDLIFGTPKQSIQELQKDLKEIISLDPEHISIYSLSFEEGTKFFHDLKAGIITKCDDELEAKMYEIIIETLEEAGYIHYEISNFAKKGFEAIHNKKYWQNKEYLGLGLGASGYIGNLRYKNQVTFNEYYDKINCKEFPHSEQEYLTVNDSLEYQAIFGLRMLKEGIPQIDYYADIIEKLKNRGFLEVVNERVTLTKKGLFYANDVLENFLIEEG